MNNVQYENVNLKGLDLFDYLLETHKPHKAIEIMINNNQDLKDVKLYLKAMLKHVKEYEIDRRTYD